MQLFVESRGTIKGAYFPLEMNMPDDATLGMLKNGIAHLVPALPMVRQRLTDAQKRPLVGDEKRLTDLGIENNARLTVKDLGPQISWRTVFLVEYAGPLIIHPIIYFLAPLVWAHFGYPFEKSLVQKLVLVLVVVHFAKREFESLFVHRFSNATMPAFNIVKNSGHYWLLSGVLLAGGVYSPSLGAKAVQGSIRDNLVYLGACVLLWIVAELGNLQSHIILMNLRPKGTRVRQIPRGALFELVSCPNYFFESLAWLSITLMTLSLSALIFLVVSTVQMALWAIKKHKNYRKEFAEQYPRQRKIMFPFVF
ncbi:very-long-chain enoyl-CoA reductase [Malassezia equina]|uniref:very-long-chain enoyl-CoA reductase n=1 Tax=Malassezia equina TaxID=1381935 RepID=A0AAF0EEC8_9BASI|nr:very-long-chain enoyl-CoA reductase [Malassezia equina]